MTVCVYVLGGGDSKATNFTHSYKISEDVESHDRICILSKKTRDIKEELGD